ncbi:MAG TPA: hypothetical protein VM487_00340 [Phycisphaerae bacterium]|nr:hypothetical protein [Phycisphaerae bacterium]
MWVIVRIRRGRDLEYWSPAGWRRFPHEANRYFVRRDAQAVVDALKLKYRDTYAVQRYEGPGKESPT